MLTAWAHAVERRLAPTGRRFGSIHAVVHDPDDDPARGGPSGGPARRTAVLVHGMYGSATTWSPVLVAGLTGAGYRVVAVDRPGHGWSARCPACCQYGIACSLRPASV